MLDDFRLVEFELFHKIALAFDTKEGNTDHAVVV